MTGLKADLSGSIDLAGAAASGKDARVMTRQAAQAAYIDKRSEASFAGTPTDSHAPDFLALPQEAVQAIPAAIYTTDAEGRITFYNEAAALLWGCRPELGKSDFCGSWKLYWPDGTPLPHDQCPMAMALIQRRLTGAVNMLTISASASGQKRH
jgi:PAS domain-containing protein